MRRSTCCLVLSASVAVAGACSRPSDRERAGDGEYAAGRYVEALAAYRAALVVDAEGRVWAKAAAAAAHAGLPAEAVDDYMRLAADDPSRTGEAADAIDALARDAERQADGVTLQAAVRGLHTIAPARPIGRYVLALARAGRVGEVDAVPLLPAAMAAAPDQGTMDSLVGAYAAALQRAGSCDQAVLAYRALLRRGAADRKAAERGLAGCAIQLGQAELVAGHPGTAFGWFAEGAQYDSTSVVGRRALLGIGEAQVATGDGAGAVSAFRAALTQLDDSISQAAAAHLTALGTAATPGESARTSTP